MALVFSLSVALQMVVSNSCSGSQIFHWALHFASEWRQPRDEIQVLRDTIVGLGVQFTQRARMLFTLLGSKNVLVLLHINWSRNSRIPKGICSIGRSMNLEI
ncbi:hypothetical protein C5167_031821 [Papaver somniferum]|uniref:Secreted protein n=1 Tax=Papaver somniferum TaxID=3469 RepID=A0A4Y7K6Q7_PAPSO|nr:hypothetical protein C5167_031821 [Papaver somniferum]